MNAVGNLQCAGLLFRECKDDGIENNRAFCYAIFY